MAYGKISSKQKEILEYIKQEILNKGYPPAVREICEAVNLLLRFILIWKLLRRMDISDVTLRSQEQLRSLMTALI